MLTPPLPPSTNSRCTTYAGSTQPYLLFGPETSATPSYTEFCFTIAYKGPSASASECYSRLEAGLYKVILGVSECMAWCRGWRAGAACAL